MSMKNENHHEHGKSCCDLWEWKGECKNECDTYFKICITKLDMPDNRVPCDVAKITTKTFDAMSSFDFGKELPGGEKNPMKFKYGKTTVCNNLYVMLCIQLAYEVYMKINQMYLMFLFFVSRITTCCVII